MLNNLQNLTLTKPISEDNANKIDQTGIQLERDVTTKLLDTLDSIDLHEMNSIKGTYTVCHTLLLPSFFHPFFCIFAFFACFFLNIFNLLYITN